MSYSSLDSKTIRPGSLASYSYYHSSIRQTAAKPYPGIKVSTYQKRLLTRLGVALAIVLALIILPLLKSYSPHLSPVTTAPKASASAPAVAATTNQCAGNTDSKAILVSISARHLWACDMRRAVYNSPVVTGMTMYPETTTPTGTYYIYAKATNLTLSGSDSAGSWNDPVSYWMPFLSNQNGTFGFHDAAWRSAAQFGNISPSSAQASHGCVELPLAAASWLYNWSVVGTAVTIKS